MIKVSITLPNNAQITFESEEAEAIQEVVGMVLRDIPRDLVNGTYAGNGGAPPTLAPEKGNDVPEEAAPEVATPGLSLSPPPVSAGHPPVVQEPPPRVPSAIPPSGVSSREEAQPVGAGRRFIEFCQSANPVGDMRRVVVAAEGASLFLDQGSVDPASLESLFQLAGWPPAHSFVQTLRNAARTKFRWLERVPGRSGHYTVTDIGLAATGLAD